ncbi:MAG: hypothetical protein QM813_05970 [Verrucomicrobiota bacterium]
MARRINKRFLIIFTSVVVVLLVAAFGVKILMDRAGAGKRSLARLKEADVLLKELETDTQPEVRLKKLRDVRDLYAKASQDNAGDLSLKIKLGDILAKLTPYDATEYTGYVNGSRKLWGDVLATDPKNTDALERLMESYYQQVPFEPKARVFPGDGALREHAQSPQAQSAGGNADARGCRCGNGSQTSPRSRWRLTRPSRGWRGSGSPNRRTRMWAS